MPLINLSIRIHRMSWKMRCASAKVNPTNLTRIWACPAAHRHRNETVIISRASVQMHMAKVHIGWTFNRLTAHRNCWAWTIRKWTTTHLASTPAIRPANWTCHSHRRIRPNRTWRWTTRPSEPHWMRARDLVIRQHGIKWPFDRRKMWVGVDALVRG